MMIETNECLPRSRRRWWLAQASRRTPRPVPTFPASGSRATRKISRNASPVRSCATTSGLPINDSARQFADSWDPSRITLPEEQCRVHVSPYIYRGPTNLRIWEEKDPKTQDLIAIKHYISTYEQTRTIWMDGRPHPGPNAPHTWMGFSTGRYDGDMLVVETTHLKQGWVRRNGVPMSDQATMTEYMRAQRRHDDAHRRARRSGVPDRAAGEEPGLRAQHARAARAARGCGSASRWSRSRRVQKARSRPTCPDEHPFKDEFARRHQIP